MSKIVESKSKVVASAPGGGFLAMARALATERGISVTEAIRRLRASDPSAYERFRAGEVQRGTRVRRTKSAGRI